MRRLIIIVVAGVLILGSILIGCSKEPGQREYEKGVREFKEGNNVRARALFENSINKRLGHSENARTYNYLGLACQQLGQLAEAVEAFEESRRINPDFMAPIYNLGVLLYQMGDAYQASALLEEASLMDGKDPRSLEFVAYIYREKQDWAQARRCLYEALGWDPQSARILTTLALVDLEMEGTDAALLHLSHALEQNPQYAPALYNLGVIYRDRVNDPDQAAGYFEQYLKVASDSEYTLDAQNFMDVYRPIPSVSATPQQVVAAKPVQTPEVIKPVVQPEKTIPVATVKPPKKIVQQTPTPTPIPVKPPEVTPKTLIRQARKSLEEGDTQKALNLVFQAADILRRQGDRAGQGAILKQAAELCFDQAKAHYAYGQYLADEGRHEEALSAFKQAAVLNSEWAAAQEALAESAIQVGEYDSALVALRKAIEMNEKNADLLWSLALLYEDKLEFPERAEQVYYTFTKRFPGDSRVLKAKQKIQIRTPSATPAPVQLRAEDKPATKPATTSNRTIPARQLQVTPPIQKNTRSAVRAYNRGTGYQSREDWDRAIYYYKQAVENDDTFVQAFYNLGTAYRMKGELDLAKDAYLRAMRLQPDMVNASYNLALIYWELKQYTAAEQHALKVVKAEPEHPYAHYLLGYIYSRNPVSQDKAKHHFQTFIALAPSDPGTASVREWLRTH